MKVIVLFALAVGMCLSGCRTKMESMRGSKEIAEGTVAQATLGTFMAWDPSWSAAMVMPGDHNRPDRMCMQNALGMKSYSWSGTGKVTDSVLSASKALEAAVKEGRVGNDLANVTASFSQAVSLLTTSTERTTFLSIGLFYICQLSANESISPVQAQQLTMELIKTAGSLNRSAEP